MKIDVLIVTYNRPELLKKCLESLINQQPHQFELNVYIFINGKDGQTLEFLNSETIVSKVIHEQHSVAPGEARNRLLSTADADYCCFIDDDVVLAENYFSKAQKIIEFDGAECFGGPDLLNLNPSYFQRAVALSQKSMLSTAHTRFRHGAYILNDQRLNSGEELILCNFWVKKTILQKLQLKFDTRFWRNEENVLIHELKKNNIQTYFFPDLIVYHFKKNSISKFIKAIFSSAKHRALSFWLYPSSFKPIYTVPSFFVISMLTLALLEKDLFKFALFSYLGIGLISMMALIVKERESWSLLIPATLLQYLTNFTYGLGMLYGLSFHLLISFIFQ